eukprot:TRINITY_DN16084_c0_g1_i3.p1 TRINITY_DN16084_c0_g1~~TRINITY_DN16084_c0_g1_i3.p1  ORF type:complete len:138 (-),score=8.10 TRINITY_DN16084_c0_g1_i3:69-482(-)
MLAATGRSQEPLRMKVTTEPEISTSMARAPARTRARADGPAESMQAHAHRGRVLGRAGWDRIVSVAVHLIVGEASGPNDNDNAYILANEHAGATQVAKLLMAVEPRRPRGEPRCGPRNLLACARARAARPPPGAEAE